MSLAFFFFSSRRRHTSLQGDWSSDVCSSDLGSPLSQYCLSSFSSHSRFVVGFQLRTLHILCLSAEASVSATTLKSDELTQRKRGFVRVLDLKHKLPSSSKP